MSLPEYYSGETKNGGGELFFFKVSKKHNKKEIPHSSQLENISKTNLFFFFGLNKQTYLLLILAKLMDHHQSLKNTQNSLRYPKTVHPASVAAHMPTATTSGRSTLRRGLVNHGLERRNHQRNLGWAQICVNTKIRELS